jgi:hypothetical protein
LRKPIDEALGLEIAAQEAVEELSSQVCRTNEE